MNIVHTLDTKLRLALESLKEPLVSQGVDGLIYECDIDRARGMTGNELAAHLAELCSLAARVVGCEQAVDAARESLEAFKSSVLFREEEYEGFRTFWWLAHRGTFKLAA